ncbi:MAG: hypothetical protein KJO05_04730 [Bacteroidia bacterium]|nr:hypothetical protein [Bacteroidia bacterium]NNF30742.1 hypothetical protein [Flavobacteriaceae bacterium]MBT8277213.1 hypothetical protein [Bacteroidia bacterium]NNJ81685.1 hypothetical protein [Flavobacteriaceae bacterium]NNK54813.1 hypothetical protein [Flavobacteriaceae bacterium]
MKKLLLILAMVGAFMACENPVSKKIKETKETVSNTRKAVKEMEKVQEDMEELKNEEPLTNEELKEWLPDEINGMKRTGYKAGQTAYLQIAQVEATYQNEDKSKKLKIQVMDGAGEMGAAATAGMRILFSQDFEEEDEYKVRRTTKKDGNKVIEEYRKDGSRSEVQFMQDDRFYIQVTGTNMDLDETWDAIAEMDPEDLG